MATWRGSNCSSTSTPVDPVVAPGRQSCLFTAVGCGPAREQTWPVRRESWLGPATSPSVLTIASWTPRKDATGGQRSSTTRSVPCAGCGPTLIALVSIPSGLAAYGWSAGGQLAALLGTRDTRIDDDPSLTGYSSRVSCVVDLAGDVDLAAYTLPPARDEVEALLGGTPESVPERYRDASPLTWVDATSAPFLIVHGLDDDVVPIEQSRRLVAALRAARVEVTYVELPQARHGDLIDTWSLAGNQTLVFLEHHLRA